MNSIVCEAPYLKLGPSTIASNSPLSVESLSSFGKFKSFDKFILNIRTLAIFQTNWLRFEFARNNAWIGRDSASKLRRFFLPYLRLRLMRLFWIWFFTDSSKLGKLIGRELLFLLGWYWWGIDWECFGELKQFFGQYTL
jgi:hypothetical protein